jgi:hypothetical protein
VRFLARRPAATIWTRTSDTVLGSHSWSSSGCSRCECSPRNDVARVAHEALRPRAGCMTAHPLGRHRAPSTSRPVTPGSSGSLPVG